MITLEDWALIRRLVADGVPQRQVARDLGLARGTVARAVEPDDPLLGMSPARCVSGSHWRSVRLSYPGSDFVRFVRHCGC